VVVVVVVVVVVFLRISGYEGHRYIHIRQQVSVPGSTNFMNDGQPTRSLILVMMGLLIRIKQSK
jgi:hypothetical protein